MIGHIPQYNVCASFLRSICFFCFSSLSFCLFVCLFSFTFLHVFLFVLSSFFLSLFYSLSLMPRARYSLLALFCFFLLQQFIHSTFCFLFFFCNFKATEALTNESTPYYHYVYMMSPSMTKYDDVNQAILDGIGK